MKNALKKLVITFGLLSFVTLIITGFLPYFLLGGAVAGCWLIIHLTAGGFFSACAAGLAVLYCEKYLFGAGRIKISLCFWAVVVLSLVVILSVLVSMLNFFGTGWQKLFLQIHLYGTIAFSLFALAYLYFSASRQNEHSMAR